jgi:Phage portal protein, SPP1 Gp6-like.
LVRDIHKFSASIDMADESFSGSAQSGESRKWKMMDLETKAANKQRKFEKGLRQQFKIICSAWQKEIPGIDYLNISWVFTRNTPQDLTYIADFAQKMNGIHSRQTLLDKIPYIDDSEYEMELMKKERDEFGDELEKPKYDFKDEKQSVEGGEKE